VIGSLYPRSRMAGVSTPEDLSAGSYRDYLAAMDAALADTPPLVFAGGHEHSLQVLRGGETAQYALVSGAGTLDRPSPVTTGDDTLFASPHAGFMRLDILKTGAVRLTVFQLNDDATPREPVSIWLDTGPAPAAGATSQ